jgi:threonine/homoserine/homoserine lactone efflux protein
MHWDVFLIGMGIGLAFAAPLGPVNLVVIRAALRQGFDGAMAAAAGTLLGDAIYAGVAAYGVRWIEDLIADWRTPLQLVGGLIIVAIGMATYAKHVTDYQLQTAAVGIGRASYAKKAATAFFMTITNPAALMAFLATFSSLGAFLNLASAPYRPLMAVVGVLVGALVWWVFLSFLVIKLKNRLTGHTLDRINHWSGAAIAAFGFAILIDLVI